MYDKIARWYKQGLWTAAMVDKAKEKGVITQEQKNLILSRDEV